MLYVTTRNTTDVHTAHHTLTKDRSVDQGLYVPFHLPRFSGNELGSLSEKSFSENVCYLLKLLLGKELNPWDLDYAIGRNPVQLAALSHKIVAAETWRNLDWNFSRLVKELMSKIHGKSIHDVFISSWAQIAVRISTVFGLFTVAYRKKLFSPETVVDVAVDEGDLSFAVSVLYCRKMGLPVGNIVCSCSEESPLWELYHTGQLLPGTVPVENMERLIYEIFGLDTTLQYIQSRTSKTAFRLSAQQKQDFREMIYPVVVSNSRSETIIPSVYRTVGYILSPESALSYGALLDYRSRVAERRPAFLLTEQSPSCQMDTVAKFMNLTSEELKERIFSK